MVHNSRPIQWEAEPNFEIAGVDRMGFTRGVPPSIMGRHFLFLGETGSGKTANGLIPTTIGIAGYGVAYAVDQPCAACLIIDPKAEVHAALINAGVNRDRIILIDNAHPITIDVFDGFNEPASIRDKLEYLLGIVSPHAKGIGGHGDNVFFHQAAFGVVARLTELAHAATRYGTTLGEAIMQELGSRGDPDGPIREMWHRLRWLRTLPGSVLFREIQELIQVGSTLNPERSARDHDQEYMLSWLYEALARCTTTFCPGAGHPLAALRGLPHRTFASVMATAHTLLEGIATPLLAQRLKSFDVGQTALDISAAINTGKIILYTPPAHRSATEDAFGKFLKTAFFRQSFAREDNRRAVAYICDEFQRYITVDDETGEQSYADRIRAYRGICVFATQSIAAVHSAVQPANRAAAPGAHLGVDALLSTIGNKVFFRTTEMASMQLLRGLIPPPSIPGMPHVLDVYPTAALVPGEYYAVLADGRWAHGAAPASSPEPLNSSRPCSIEMP